MRAAASWRGGESARAGADEGAAASGRAGSGGQHGFETPRIGGIREVRKISNLRQEAQRHPRDQGRPAGPDPDTGDRRPRADRVTRWPRGRTHGPYLPPVPHQVKAAVGLCAAAATIQESARAIYQFVRDLDYEGGDFEDLEIYRASSVLAGGRGYCVGKASLCAALARSAGIPARVAFADVRNHLAAPRLLRAMGTDIFAWHGYTELLLRGQWVKVSPTFDTVTCQRAGVAPLEFDARALPGRRDAPPLSLRPRPGHQPVQGRAVAGGMT
jgi:transglutaminase-like putative cysteine protease